MCYPHFIYNITMFSNLASRFPNFFAINWKSAPIASSCPTFMDLVTAVIICNCAIVLITIAITIWTKRLSRQIVSLTDFFDRCLSQWQQLSLDSATLTAADRIHRCRQIYQQQLATLDRIGQLRSLFGVARFLILKRH
jgi:cell division protein FtsL